MPHQERVLTADLGPTVAALTAYVKGRPIAVVNSAVTYDPTMRVQAAWALLGVGLDAGAVLGALNGVRS